MLALLMALSVARLRSNSVRSCLGDLRGSAAVQVDLTLNIVERKTGGLSCGGGISSQGHSEGALPGFIGSASFSQRNLFGLNQKLAATVEIGQVHILRSFLKCSKCSAGQCHMHQEESCPLIRSCSAVHALAFAQQIGVLPLSTPLESTWCKAG